MFFDVVHGSAHDNATTPLAPTPAAAANPAAATSKKKTKKYFTPVQKIHGVAVHVLRSSIRRKKMRRLTRRHCVKKYRNRVMIRGMFVRWGSQRAEIVRGIELRPAVNQYIETLPDGLTGKKKAAATRLQKQLALSHEDWEVLDTVQKILEPFDIATKELSLAGVPTLCMLLPLYKILQEQLTDWITVLSEKDDDKYGIIPALERGRAKLQQYEKKALKSDYPLLATVLNPATRLAFFEDEERWDPSVPARARVLLEHICEEYYNDELERSSPSRSSPSASSTAQASTTESQSEPAPAPTGSLFSKAIRKSTAASTSSGEAVRPKPWMLQLDSYLNGSFPLEGLPNETKSDTSGQESDIHRILPWWRAYGANFGPLAQAARDILAIAGVSISVERLFSSSARTMTDARSRLTSESAAKAVITKEWLKQGLGDNVQYLEGVSIWENGTQI